MKMYSKEGQPMVDVTKIGVEGDKMFMQAKLMNAYSMKIYLEPSELRSALALINWDVVSALPGMLTSGTQCEEQLSELGKILGGTMKENVKILLGPNASEKVQAITTAMGANSTKGLFDALMVLLQIVLANKQK